MPESDPGPPPKKRRLLRRVLFGLVLFGVALVLALPLLIDAFGGASRKTAYQTGEPLSPAARAFLEDVYADLDRSRLIDYHTHVAGQGNGSECWVNPRMQSRLHVQDWFRFRFYLSAAGIADPNGSDAQFTGELAKLVRAQPYPSRHLILAFDYRYGADGVRDLEHSEFHVPNDWVLEVAGENADVFLPAMSVHPYRADAIEELERGAARGMKLVKWLPSAMGIDPADERCDPFYARMRELGVTLLTHGGEEQAVEAEQDQELSNPLRLRRPLRAGVKVIVAHCASSGEGEDLDRPSEGRKTNFALFLRLMGESEWQGQLFGELSTVTQTNRYRMALAELLVRTDLHPRLVNGSDYPLPAINVLYRTGQLCRAGFLTADEGELLNELFHYNPLVFDLALKRTVHHPDSGERFSADVFHGRAGLGY
ncbi:MAG: amidohydrolase family protein [bacterium]|nr:amidohydrolase family protein [bacterium]